jgi:hypothetical protein
MSMIGALCIEGLHALPSHQNTGQNTILVSLTSLLAHGTENGHQILSLVHRTVAWHLALSYVDQYLQGCARLGAPVLW